MQCALSKCSTKCLTSPWSLVVLLLSFSGVGGGGGVGMRIKSTENLGCEASGLFSLYVTKMDPEFESTVLIRWIIIYHLHRINVFLLL